MRTLFAGEEAEDRAAAGDPLAREGADGEQTYHEFDQPRGGDTAVAKPDADEHQEGEAALHEGVQRTIQPIGSEQEDQ